MMHDAIAHGCLMDIARLWVSDFKRIVPAMAILSILQIVMHI